MNTAKQEQLIRSFLEALEEEIRPVYQDLIEHLTGLGYAPRKTRSSLSFQHKAHNKQIAKMRLSKGGPVFSLRFSACQEYSRRFAEVIAAWIENYPTRTAGCPQGKCSFCVGAPRSHVYECTLHGERKAHCGAYALPIPDLSAEDVAEIKELLHQEHVYLMKQEAGIAV